MTTTEHPRRDFTLNWALEVSPAEVFRAWTDPDHLDWFYNPDNPMPAGSIELDLRVGGVWRQRMIIDSDTDYFTGGVYREIVPDEKLVFAWGATGGFPALDPDRLEDSPLVTVTLTGDSERTEMSVHLELPAGLSEDDVREWLAMGIRNGWRDTVDRLAAAFAKSATTA